MIRILVSLIAALAITLTACAGKPQAPVSSGDIGRVKSLVTVSRETSELMVRTPMKTALGPFSKSKQAVAGRMMKQHYGLTDPAQYVSNWLTAHLHRQHGLQVLQFAEVPASFKGEPVSIASQPDYRLEVKTVNWAVTHFPLHPSVYRAVYQADVSLTEVVSGAVIAKQKCRRQLPYSDKTAISYKRLGNNNAELLKKAFRYAAEDCIQQFLRKDLSAL